MKMLSGILLSVIAMSIDTTGFFAIVRRFMNSLN